MSPNGVQSSCIIKCIGVHNSIQKTLFLWYQSIRLAFLLELKSVRGLHCLFIGSPSLLFSFVWPSSPNSLISLFFCQDVRSSRDCPTPVAAATPFHKECFQCTLNASFFPYRWTKLPPTVSVSKDVF